MKLKYVNTLTYASVLGMTFGALLYMDRDLKLKPYQAILGGLVVGGMAFLAAQFGGIGSVTTEEIIEHEKK